MRKAVLVCVVLLTMALSGCCCNKRTVCVARPPVPALKVEDRGAPPCPRAKWIPGHWKWEGRARGYVWVPGHWR